MNKQLTHIALTSVFALTLHACAVGADTAGDGADAASDAGDPTSMSSAALRRHRRPDFVDHHHFGRDDDGHTGEGDAAPASDSGSTAADAGTVATDTGSIEIDTGSPAADTGTHVTDTGSVATDTGTHATDTGSTAADTGTHATDSGAATSGTTITTMLTFYGWPDNSPAGDGIALPVIHKRAGGTGTYADPVTFASASSEYAAGTILYVPLLQKYIVMEDTCAACTSDWSAGRRHLDVWMNSDATNTSKLLSCQDAWTRDAVPVEVSPPPTRPVNPVPLFTPSTGVCLTP